MYYHKSLDSSWNNYSPKTPSTTPSIKPPSTAPNAAVGRAAAPVDVLVEVAVEELVFFASVAEAVEEAIVVDDEGRAFAALQ